MDKLEEIYNKYNFPGMNKLFQLAEDEGLNVKRSDVQKFIKNQKVSQVFSQPVKKPGHIVAFHPHEKIQMDLIDMSKFKNNNKGFAYLLFVIDVFTRQVYIYPIKNKTISEIENQLEKHFSSINKPSYITSDSEPAFLSKQIQELLNNNNIYHNVVDKGNHKALGVIDRAILTIKQAIYERIFDKGNTRYIDELQSVVDAYNNTPHEGLNNLKPNKVKDNIDTVQILNHRKYRESQKSQPKFKVGDIVRVQVQKTVFSRGFDKQYSQNTFTIEKIELNFAKLSNGNVVPFRRLKLVSRAQEDEIKEDVVAEATRVQQSEQRRKREGRDLSSIIEQRTRGKRVPVYK